MNRTAKLVLSTLAAFALMSSCGSNVIARIEFSGDGKTAEMRNISYDLSEIESMADELDDALGAPPILKNVKWNIDYDTLLGVFEMSDSECEKQSDPEARTYTSGSKSIVIYGSGVMSYKDSSLYDLPCELTEEEAESLAREKMTAAGFDISDMTVSNASTEEDGTMILVFGRQINGLKVVGNTGATVAFNGNGISSLSFMSTAYSEEIQFEPIGVKAAAAELLTEKSSQTFGRQAGQNMLPIRTVRVTGVEFVYWDSVYTQTKMNQTHIQPVYCFTGICTDADGNETQFTGYVRAVSDSRTTNFRVDEIE